MNINRRSIADVIRVVVALLLCLGAAPGTSAGQRADPAHIILAAQLFVMPDKDSTVSANLPAGEVVTVVAMKGAFSQVKAAAGEGWVLSSRLRIGQAGTGGDSTAPAQGGSSADEGGSSWLRGLTSMLRGSDRRTNSGANVTVGIRGLQREDVSNARPDTAAVAELERFAVSAAQAEQRARTAGLQAVDVAYLSSGASPGSDTTPQGTGADR